MRWRNKKLVTKFFLFYCWQQILIHNSGNRCDRTVRFAALCIVFRCAYDDMEKWKIVDKIVSTLTAGSIFWSITRVTGVIEQLGLRRYASFSDALTMRWRNKKLVIKNFPLTLLAAKIMWFSSITQVIGVTEQFGLRRYALFSGALTMRWRNKKLATKFFPLLLLAAKIMWFSSITQVIGVIEQFGLRRYASFWDALTMIWWNKELRTKFFPLLLLAAKIMLFSSIT